MVEERQKDGDALGGQRTLATSNGRLAFIEATEPLFLDWLTEPGASKKTVPLVKRLPVGPLREVVQHSPPAGKAGTIHHEWTEYSCRPNQGRVPNVFRRFQHEDRGSQNFHKGRETC
jgi:hypothetical protein